MIILQQSLVQFSVQSEGEEDIAVSKTLFLFPSIGFREFIFLSLMVAGKCALYDTTRPKRGAARVSATNPNVMFPRWILAKRPIVRPRFPATIGNRTKNTGRADGLIDQRGPGWSPFLAATGGCRVEKSLSQNIVIYLYWIIN